MNTTIEEVTISAVEDTVQNLKNFSHISNVSPVLQKYQTQILIFSFVETLVPLSAIALQKREAFNFFNYSFSDYISQISFEF